jgi:hypothetical protein
LKVVTIFGRDLVLPFIGWTRVRDFENIDDGTRSKIKRRFQEIEEMTRGIMERAKTTEDKARWVAPAIRKLRELSAIMLESNDVCLRAFGSQLKLTASIPEITRSALPGIAGQYTIETTSRMNIESIRENDYLRGFYLNTLFFYKWFQSVEGAPEIRVNRIELGEELMKAGKILKKDYTSLSPVYKIFVRYCNKQMAGIETMPEILFIVNYLHRILVEVLYESGDCITGEEREKFCKFFGNICCKIGEGLKYQDRMLIASKILELYEYAEHRSGEIYGN